MASGSERALRRASCIATLWLALAACAAAPQARAEPALWEVKSRTATVYLFGTIHLLRPEVRWRTPKLARAFSRSDELWLEVADPGDAEAVLPAVKRLGFDPQTPLSKKLTRADRARLQADARALGEPAADFEPMRPWLAAVRLSVAPLEKAGFDPDAGVDRLLRRRAVLDGRPIRAFETAEQQIRYMSELPEPLQIAELRLTLDEFPTAAAKLEKLEGAWEAGDVAAIDRALNADMKRKSPELYRVMLVERNRAFARRILQRLSGRGVAFVAVGAGHLVGPDGVQALLARRGLRVRRL